MNAGCTGLERLESGVYNPSKSHGQVCLNDDGTKCSKNL
jgi:hypothetical protein